MSFWSGETLRERMASVIEGPDYREDAIDCNAYTLHLGAEMYVSPSKKSLAARAKARLEKGSGLAIPPGQFAFLLTEESIHIPADAMAFISMRSTYKLKGLVNVSGFHVDPGYRGRLIFAVFNASANYVQVHRGDACFLLWLADLDRPSLPPYIKTQKGFCDIPSAIINPVASGKIESIAGLSSRIDKLRNRLAVLSAIVFVSVGSMITAAVGQWREGATPPVTVVVPTTPVPAEGNSVVEPNPESLRRADPRPSQ